MLRWLKLTSTGFWGGAIIFIRTIAGFGMQKFVAIFYGPAGTTLFSHFQNLISLFTQPVQDAIAQGLISAYPKKSFSKNKLIYSAIGFTTFIFLAIAILLIITGAFPDELFNFSIKNWWLILIGVFLLCLQGLASAILIAQQKLKLLSILYLLQWSILFIFILLNFKDLDSTLQYYIFVQGFFVFVFAAFLYKDINQKFPKSFRKEKEIVNHFKQFLWMALAVWISSKWVDFFIREYAINLFGSIETGFWQSIVRISEAYRALFISFLFITFYPIISNLYQNKSKKLKTHFRTQFLKFSAFTLLFFIIVYILRKPIITSLYSIEYIEAASLFQFQIIGDIFAFISFPFALMLMASVQTKNYILCELSSAFIFVICILIGNKAGIEILVYAHIIRFILYLSLVVFFTRKNWNFA